MHLPIARDRTAAQPLSNEIGSRNFLSIYLFRNIGHVIVQRLKHAQPPLAQPRGVPESSAIWAGAAAQQGAQTKTDTPRTVAALMAARYARARTWDVLPRYRRLYSCARDGCDQPSRATYCGSGSETWACSTAEQLTRMAAWTRWALVASLAHTHSLNILFMMCPASAVPCVVSASVSLAVFGIASLTVPFAYYFPGVKLFFVMDGASDIYTVDAEHQIVVFDKKARPLGVDCIEFISDANELI